MTKKEFIDAVITEKSYLEAQKIVDAYKEQLRIADVMRINSLKEAQFKREQECRDHYYILSNDRYSSDMTCQDCGKRQM